MNWDDIQRREYDFHRRIRERTERKRRRLYSFRDRIQPPKLAQPSATASTYTITESRPEGRPAKYQYPQYERRPYGFERGSLWNGLMRR